MRINRRGSSTRRWCGGSCTVLHDGDNAKMSLSFLSPVTPNWYVADGFCHGFRPRIAPTSRPLRCSLAFKTVYTCTTCLNDALRDSEVLCDMLVPWVGIRPHVV